MSEIKFRGALSEELCLYSFRGIKPVSYPIPDDGPVGKLLGLLGRHPFQPAHMHYYLSAPGHEDLITHNFVSDDKYLASDAVFGVKKSLIAPFEPVSDGETVWRALSELTNLHDIDNRLSHFAMLNPVSFRYFKTSPEIIQLAVMLYVRFPLSLRNVEDLVDEPGVDVSYESVRYWWHRFGSQFASQIKKRREGH